MLRERREYRQCSKQTLIDPSTKIKKYLDAQVIPNTMKIVIPTAQPATRGTGPMPITPKKVKASLRRGGASPDRNRILQIVAQAKQAKEKQTAADSRLQSAWRTKGQGAQVFAGGVSTSSSRVDAERLDLITLFTTCVDLMVYMHMGKVCTIDVIVNSPVVAA
ncbi:unnamed protein product [Peniophora sp. CBMAI 1063]|nr:unnamed protein product [Peniophora sp. CBMAI 1063]